MTLKLEVTLGSKHMQTFEDVAFVLEKLENTLLIKKDGNATPCEGFLYDERDNKVGSWEIA